MFALVFSMTYSALCAPATQRDGCLNHQKLSTRPGRLGKISQSTKLAESSDYEIERGSILENEGDLENSKIWYLKAARQGDSVGQYNVGRICAQGEEGRSQPDYHCAIKWFYLSASQDNQDAQYALGMLYFGGVGVPKNYDLVRKWIEKSALNGSARAQAMLGTIYQEGIGLGRSYKLATFWFRRAANQNLATAQFQLGLQYLHGYGVSRNELTALMWFFIAKNHGASVSDGTLQRIKDRLGSAGVKKAQEMAQNWHCRA